MRLVPPQAQKGGSLDQSRSSSERDNHGHRFENAVPVTATLENIQKLLAEPWPGEDLGATRNA